MPLTGTVDAANARIDLFVDYTTEAGIQTFATLVRHVGGPTNGPGEYVRGLFGTTLLGEQAYVSDHEAPLDAEIWYTAVSGPDSVTLTAGPFTIPSSGYVWMKDPGRPWADLRLDLCVTPDDGKDPCPAVADISDTFSRVSASGWGNADTGQAWTFQGGVAADYTVTGTTGRHISAAANLLRYSIATAPSADVGHVVDWTVGDVPVGASSFVFTFARFLDTTHFYFTRVEIAPTGAMTLTLRKRNVTESQLGASYATGLTMTAGAWFRTRFQVEGNILRARVWPRDGAEPEVWHLNVSDNDLTAAGSVGVRTLLNTGATGPLPYTFDFDNLAVSAIEPATPDDVVWVGFQNKVRAADAGLFPVLDSERPADVYARRKDITTGALFLTRSREAIDLVYELYTAGGPILFQVPVTYHMNSPHGQRDRYYQPDDLTEGYLSQDQRRPIRLWTVPLVNVEVPVGLPQGTDTANWCALADTYATFADMTATGYTWGQAATGAATSPPTLGLYGGGTYGGGIYGG